MKKKLSLCVLCVLLVLFLFFFYKKMKNKKAEVDLYPVVEIFEKKDYRKALSGDNILLGFLEIIIKHKGTFAANTAKLYSGISLIKLGYYDLGIKYLISVKINDDIMKSKVFCFIADAYSELGDFKNALKFYFKAANVYDNDIDNPYFLFKAVNIYEKKKEYKKALNIIETILSKYKMNKDYNKYLNEKKKLEVVINKLDK